MRPIEYRKSLRKESVEEGRLSRAGGCRITGEGTKPQPSWNEAGDNPDPLEALFAQLTEEINRYR